MLGLRPRLVKCALWLLLSATPLGAQEIQWRTDYGTAMKEAGDKRKPVFLDVGSAGCIHCVNLDHTTFRDPEMIKILNDNFVPAKVDGGATTIYVQGKPITSFPTLIFIGPDNKLLGQQEGFVDAGNLKQQAQRVLATLKPVAVVSKSAPPQQTVAPAKPTPPPAASTNTAASSPSPSSQPVEPTATALATPKRPVPPFQADLKVGPSAEALNVWPLQQPRPQNPGLYLQPFEERVFRARHLLQLAQEDYQRQQWVACLEHCKALALLYPDLPEGVEARQLTIRIRSNPELLERLGRDLTESLAECYWDLANSKLRQNQATQAIPYLEKIIQTCPNTRYAPAAQDYLNRLVPTAALLRR